MQELFGICTNCQTGVIFKVLTILNQADDVVLAEAQCQKCKLHASVYFRVNNKDYKPITSKGEGIEDNDSAPHSGENNLDF